MWLCLESQEAHGGLMCKGKWGTGGWERWLLSPAPSKAVGMTAMMLFKHCKFTSNYVGFYFNSFLLVESFFLTRSITYKTLEVFLSGRYKL